MRNIQILIKEHDFSQVCLGLVIIKGQFILKKKPLFGTVWLWPAEYWSSAYTCVYHNPTTIMDHITTLTSANANLPPYPLPAFCQIKCKMGFVYEERHFSKMQHVTESEHLSTQVSHADVLQLNWTPVRPTSTQLSFSKTVSDCSYICPVSSAVWMAQVKTTDVVVLGHV